MIAYRPVSAKALFIVCSFKASVPSGRANRTGQNVFGTY